MNDPDDADSIDNMDYWKQFAEQAIQNLELAQTRILELAEKQAREKADFWLKETKGRNPF